MIRARSLSNTALVCAALGWLVAAGCSKPRNSNTPSNNASVAPGDTTSSYGGATPGDTSKSNLNGVSSDTGRALTQSQAAPTHHRSRTGRHVRRARPDTTSSYPGATPTRTDTTVKSNNLTARDTATTAAQGRTDTTRTAGQYAMNAPASSQSACTATASTACASQPSAANASPASPAVASADTTSALRRDTTGAVTAGAKSDTSWLYGGSSPARRDTAATRADSINHINPTDTSRLGVGSSSATSTSSYGGQTGVDTGKSRGSMGAMNATANDTGRAGGSANLSDGQIADLVVIANTADSTAGALAQRRSTSQPVKDFGRQMMQDHGANNRQVRDLARRVNVAPVSSDDSRNLRNDADDAMRNMQSKSGADFDRAYIDHEVDMHEKILRTLDEKLIPSADNAELKTLLQQTRGVVNQHLQRAREIQTALRQQ